MRPNRKRRRRIPQPVIRSQPLHLAWLLVAAACDRPADTGAGTGLPAGVPFLERDSAGVLVAVTLGARARTPVGWIVDTLPEYQIGEVDGAAPYLFTFIGGVQQLSDGRVAVLDERSCELRFFGADGAFLEQKGGRGEGPGEFHPRALGCVLVPSPGNDSLRVFEGWTLSFFDDRGRFSHRQRASWDGERVQRIHGVAGERVLVERRDFPSHNEHPDSRTVGVTEPSASDFALFDLETWTPVWEGFYLGTRYYRTRPSNAWPIPFDILPDAVMGRDGLFLTLGEEQGPEILEYDMSGHLRRVIRLAEPAAAPSPGDIDKLVEFQLDPYDMTDSTRRRRVDNYMSAYGQMPLPRVLPVFSRLLVDEVGLLWAELYRFDIHAPVRWLVFGPDGEGLGSVDVPPDLEVLQIGRDYVLGLWEGELDVEYVRRHALVGRG